MFALPLPPRPAARGGTRLRIPHVSRERRHYATKAATIRSIAVSKNLQLSLIRSPHIPNFIVPPRRAEPHSIRHGALARLCSLCHNDGRRIDACRREPVSLGNAQAVFQFLCHRRIGRGHILDASGRLRDYRLRGYGAYAGRIQMQTSRFLY